MSLTLSQTWFPKLFVLLLLLSAFVLSCSTDTSYLEGMPTAENANSLLKSKIHDTDSMTVYAKRVGSLRQLNNIIRNVMARERALTQKESELSAGYFTLAETIKKDYSSSLKTGKLKQEFENACYKWEEDGGLEDLVLNSIVSPKAKEKFDEKIKSIEDGQNGSNSTTTPTKKVFGIALMVIPFTIYAFWRGKRKFNRTNSSGTQEYDSYGKMVSSNAVETIASFVAGCAILIGFLLFLGVL